MEFEKLISPSLKELFISNIEAKILSGELPVGQQLPPERQLAQSMGVSRAVVNSGIVELENRGFLDVRPRVGTFVADYRRAGTMETLKSIMTYNRGRLRNEEIRSILEVRDALDKLAVADIIPHVTELDNMLLLEKVERFCALHGIDTLYQTSCRLCGHIRDKDIPGAVAWIDYCTRETVSGSRRIYY